MISKRTMIGAAAAATVLSLGVWVVPALASEDSVVPAPAPAPAVDGSQVEFRSEPGVSEIHLPPPGG